MIGQYSRKIEETLKPLLGVDLKLSERNERRSNKKRKIDMIEIIMLSKR